MPDIPVPLVGPSNEGIHLKADCQKTINLFPIKVEREGEKVRWHLAGTPGLAEFITLPKSPVRGALTTASGRSFRVAGSGVYEIYSDGTDHQWGVIGSVYGKVTLCELAGLIIIGDGAAFYSLDVTAGTISVITDAPRGRHCFSFNQRVHYVERGNDVAPGQVFYSEILDPTNIPGANFYTAENKPDGIVTALATEDQIWLFGTETIEIWYDTGDANTPFQRVPAGIIFSGISAEDTALQLDNALWWLEQDAQGQGIVRRSNGFTPVRVSTAAVERFASSATFLSAYSYQEQGESFFVLNADQGTWSYGIRSTEWHERRWLNQGSGALERGRPEIHAFAFGKHLVSDWENGTIYEQSLNYFDDAGTPQVRRRVSGHIDFAGKVITVDELWIDIATGVGLNDGQGSDPTIMVRYSRDGGQNWSNELHKSLGALGNTTRRVQFNRFGSGTDWAFEISVSDPVQVVILQAIARVRVGGR